jgi:hypothetical protein
VPVKAVVGYTGATAPVQASFNLTTTATRYQANSSVIVPTNTRQAEVYFAWTPSGTAGADDSFYIDDVQLEVVPASSGYTSSNFERLNFNETLQLCKRHYQKTFPYNVAPATNTGSATGAMRCIAVSTTAPAEFYLSLPVDLRVASATTTLYNPEVANAQIRNITKSADWSASAVGADGVRQIIANGSPNGTMAAFDQIAVHVTSDAGI